MTQVQPETSFFLQELSFFVRLLLCPTQSKAPVKAPFLHLWYEAGKARTLVLDIILGTIDTNHLVKYTFTFDHLITKLWFKVLNTLGYYGCLILYIKLYLQSMLWN